MEKQIRKFRFFNSIYLLENMSGVNYSVERVLLCLEIIARNFGDLTASFRNGADVLAFDYLQSLMVEYKRKSE